MLSLILLFYPVLSNSCDSSCLTCQDTKCETCYSNASLFSGSCVCNSGYFPSPTASSCQSCSHTCNECSAFSVCTSCATPRSLVNSECPCLPGFYDNSALCQQCDPDCYSCSGPGYCLSCFPNSQVTTDGTCACLDGYFPNPTASNCSSCDAGCRTCTASRACLTCYTNASIVSSICQCNSGYQGSPDASNCQSTTCAALCATCSPSTVCLSCVSNANLVSGVCLCNLGYFVSSGTCLPCHPTCQSCIDATETGCSGCKSNAYLTSLSKCSCGDGSYPSPDSSNCLQCPDSCLSCTSSVCSHCSSGYWLTQGSCQACPTNCATCDNRGMCSACMPDTYLTLLMTCIACPTCNQPLTATITSPYLKEYKVEFNRNVTKTFEGLDFALSTIPQSPIQWQVITGIELLLKVDGGPWPNTTLITVTFTHPELIIDTFGSFLSTAVVSLPPPMGLVQDASSEPSNSTSELPQPSSSSSQSTNDTVKSVASVGSSVVAGTVLAGGAVGAASLAVGLINQMEYFSYLSSTGVQLPSGIDQFFSSMNQKSTIPNFFARAGIGRGRRLAAVETGEPDFFGDMEQFFSLLLIIVGLHCGVSMLSKVWSKQPLLKAAKSKFEWSIYLYFWCFSYLDLSILCFRQMKAGSLSRDDLPRLVATVLSVALSCFLALTPMFLYALIRKHRDDLFTPDSTPQKTAWAPVASHIRLDVSFAQYYLPVTYTQRLMYAGFLVLLAEHRYVQCVVLLFPPILVTAFVVSARPLMVKAMRVLLIAAELETLSVYVCVCVLTFGYTDSHQIVAWLIASLTVKSLVCLLGITCIGICLRIQTVCGRRKAAKVQPGSNLPMVRDTVLTEVVEDSMVEAIKPKFFERALHDARDMKSSHYLSIKSPTSTSSGGYPALRPHR